MTPAQAADKVSTVESISTILDIYAEQDLAREYLGTGYRYRDGWEAVARATQPLTISIRSKEREILWFSGTSG
jgi:hypothetical protein